MSNESNENRSNNNSEQATTTVTFSNQVATKEYEKLEAPSKLSDHETVYNPLKNEVSDEGLSISYGGDLLEQIKEVMEKLGLNPEDESALSSFIQDEIENGNLNDSDVAILREDQLLPPGVEKYQESSKNIGQKENKPKTAIRTVGKAGPLQPQLPQQNIKK